mmetsp:Transcript_25961/g.72699  ORF Transcript_25961/g.72699 Transcript_25961/m.72699 type:complete len:355 (+) Transcript_25961:78-1142(+)
MQSQRMEVLIDGGGGYVAPGAVAYLLALRDSPAAPRLPRRATPAVPGMDGSWDLDQMIRRHRARFPSDSPPKASVPVLYTRQWQQPVAWMEPSQRSHPAMPHGLSGGLPSNLTSDLSSDCSQHPLSSGSSGSYGVSGNSSGSYSDARISAHALASIRTRSLNASPALPWMGVTDIKDLTPRQPVVPAKPRTPLNGDYCVVVGCTSPIDAGRYCTEHAKLVCSTRSCNRMAEAGSFKCNFHQRSRSCKVVGCQRSAQQGGACVNHGGGKKCAHPGCNKSSQTQGRCARHGGRRECIVKGCHKYRSSNGRCMQHGGQGRCRRKNCYKMRKAGDYCLDHAEENDAHKVRGVIAPILK